MGEMNDITTSMELNFNNKSTKREMNAYGWNWWKK
jgi:hypothetical protein